MQILSKIKSALLSNALRMAPANSSMVKGFFKNSRIPDSFAISCEVLPLSPVQRMMGMLLRTFKGSGQGLIR